ncbi:MAG: acetate--CoA ligase family protein [Candidatus Micrarchaeaceae archaeon]
MILVDFMEAKRIMEKYGLRVVRSGYVGSEDEAERFWKGKDIVLKAISEKALHKSKAGLVISRIRRDEIREKYAELRKRAERFSPFKILAQDMAEGGDEFIYGSREDSQFGKICIFGLGGIYVELFNDVSIRVLPASVTDIEEMLGELRSKRLIEGREGMVIDIIKKLSKFSIEEEFSELDINPIIIGENSYSIVDIRMIR